MPQSNWNPIQLLNKHLHLCLARDLPVICPERPSTRRAENLQEVLTRWWRSGFDSAKPERLSSSTHRSSTTTITTKDPIHAWWPFLSSSALTYLIFHNGFLKGADLIVFSAVDFNLQKDEGLSCLLSVQTRPRTFWESPLSQSWAASRRLWTWPCCLRCSSPSCILFSIPWSGWYRLQTGRWGKISAAWRRKTNKGFYFHAIEWFGIKFPQKTHWGRGPCMRRQWVRTRRWNTRRSRRWPRRRRRWWEGCWTGCSWETKARSQPGHVTAGGYECCAPGCSYLSRLLMEEVPLSTLLSTSPVRLSRCQRRDRPCKWANKHTWSVKQGRLVWLFWWTAAISTSNTAPVWRQVTFKAQNNIKNPKITACCSMLPELLGW